MRNLFRSGQHLANLRCSSAAGAPGTLITHCAGFWLENLRSGVRVAPTYMGATQNMSKKKRLKTPGKVIVLNNQKGGVGKTTIAYHVGCYLASQGYKVVAIDLDGQGNLSGRFFPLAERISGYRAVHLFTSASAEFAPLTADLGVDVIYALKRDVELFNVERMPLGEAAANFYEKVSQLREDYDFIVVDTPPALGNMMTAACIAADFLFVPVELAAFAVEGVENVLETLQEIGQLTGSEVKVTGVICNKLRAVNSHSKSLAELRQAVGPLILKNCLVNRGSVDEAMGDRIPVWQRKSTGAQRDTGREMTQLMAEMAGLCGIKIDTKARARK
ncbi:ParA family protein [Stutzerimonas xanthomarina]|uniref:ParA family protein n=2 Tax=Pseudomonadaceae TaxID=135621 RepID=A0A427DPH4_9GAMM|nr:ParA family protein [Stutzerimonas xanthomarina]